MLRSWRELRDARRKGRRDGRAGVPAVDAESLPFDLREIRARAEERVHRLVQRWKQEDRSLDAELGDLGQREVAANARLADAEMQRDAALATDESRKADEEQRLTRLQQRLEDLPTPDDTPFEIPEAREPELRATPAVSSVFDPALPRVETSRLAPELPDLSALAVDMTDVSWHGIGSIVYWALVALIVIGEIPLNAFAFRLFHESDLLTYAMTVTVAVGLVAFAHGLGLLVSRPERTTVERILVGAFTVVPLAAITVISLVRYGYLTDVGGDTGVGPVLGTLAFGCINLLVFGAAAGLSYLHHDPRTLVNRRAAVRTAERERARAARRSAEVERAQQRREYRRQDDARKREEDLARRRMAREQERRRREIEIETARRTAAVQVRKTEVIARREQVVEAMRPLRDAARERAERLGEMNALVDAARAELGTVEQRIASIAGERRALCEATDAQIREERAGHDRLVFAYCSANVRARVGHDTPRCLEFIPPLEAPAEFEAAMAEVTR
jgi:hypothetical protein